MLINICFFIELLSDFVMRGLFESYSKNFRMWPETLCQLFNFMAIYYFFSN